MAKRFTISLPDEFAARIEPILPRVSLSAIMQKALEIEFARLTQSGEDLDFAEALQQAAKEFWKTERAHLAHAAEVLVDHFLKTAIQDRDYRIFKLYAYSRRMDRKDLPEKVRDAASDAYGDVAGDILSEFQEMIFRSLSDDNPIVPLDRLAPFCENDQEPDDDACFQWLSENHPDLWPFIDEELEKKIEKFDIPKEMLI